MAVLNLREVILINNPYEYFISIITCKIELSLLKGGERPCCEKHYDLQI